MFSFNLSQFGRFCMGGEMSMDKDKFEHWSRSLNTPGLNISIQQNTFCGIDKYTLQFGQMHLAIWKITFCTLDKYI